MYYEEVTKEERKDISERLDSKDKKIELLLSKIKDFEEKIADQEKNLELLARLYDSDIIKKTGYQLSEIMIKTIWSNNSLVHSISWNSLIKVYSFWQHRIAIC